MRKVLSKERGEKRVRASDVERYYYLYGRSVIAAALCYVRNPADADNVQPAVNENTGKMIYDSGIVWEKYAVAIPDATRYKFNGFVVEPRWCYFDGIKVRIAYDIIGENPDISKINVSGNGARDGTRTVEGIQRSLTFTE